MKPLEEWLPERREKTIETIASSIEQSLHGKCPPKWIWLTFGDVCCSSHIDRSFYRKKKTFVEGSGKDESEASTCSAGGMRRNRS